MEGKTEAAELHSRHTADMLTRSPAFIERVTWTPTLLRDEREDALRRLLRVALDNSPWHARRLRGVDPARFRVEDLTSLPPMTKSDLMDHFDEIVTDHRLDLALLERHLTSLTTDTYLLGRYHGVASGGSSGQRGVFIYDWDAWISFYLSLQRFFLRDWHQDPSLDGVHRRVAVVAAGRASHMSSALGQTFSSPDTEIRNFPVTAPLARIVGDLNQWQPNVLQGYSSMLHQLAIEARAGRLSIRPRRIRSRSEPLLPEIRSGLEATWGVTVHNDWVCTEGATATTCGRGTGLHVSEDLIIIEPVDAAGRPVVAGLVSDKVYLTNLYNLAVPLIRYELTDQVTILDGDCPCGSPYRRIRDIQGRLEDLFDYGAGVRVHPHVFRSVLGRQPMVTDYQVRQTSAGAAISITTAAPLDTRPLGQQLRAALQELGLTCPDVTVSVVTALDRTALGKLRRFVPRSHS